MDKVKATWKIHEKLWFFALLIFSGAFMVDILIAYEDRYLPMPRRPILSS